MNFVRDLSNAILGCLIVAISMAVGIAGGLLAAGFAATLIDNDGASVSLFNAPSIIAGVLVSLLGMLATLNALERLRRFFEGQAR